MQGTSSVCIPEADQFPTPITGSRNRAAAAAAMLLAAARRHAAAVSAPSRAAAYNRHKTRPCVTAAAAATGSRAAVGIDLGTTNSAVAVLREGETRPTVIRTSSSSSSSGSSFTIPSVVAYQSSATDTPLVGAAAKQQAAANPSNSFYSVKRLMGRSWQEAQDLGLLYGLQEAADGGVELVCPAQGKALSPQQVRPAALCWPFVLCSLSTKTAR